MLVRLAAGVGTTDPAAPTRAVNETSQTVLTMAIVVAAVGVLVWAAQTARARRSAGPLVLALGPIVGVVCEPLWNEAFNLFWYEPGQWSLFSSFGTPQPVWMAGMYTIIYTGPALLVLRRVDLGLTRQALLRLFVVASLAIMLLEECVINAGVYRYYGELQFRVWGPYPLWAGVMEGAFISVLAVLVARIVPLLRGAANLLLLPLFSVTFCGVFFGAGIPAIVLNNADGVPTAVRYLGATAAVLLAATTVWVAGFLLPSERAGDPVLEVRDGAWALRHRETADVRTSRPTATPAREPVNS